MAIVKKRKRKSKLELEPSVEKVILGVLSVGAGRVAAAAQAGITDRCLRYWVERGEAGEEPFASLLMNMHRAEQANKVFYLDTIKAAARGGDWRAAQAGLEKQFPKEYGPRMHLDADIKVGPTFNLDKLDDEELRQLKKLQEKAG